MPDSERPEPEKSERAERTSPAPAPPSWPSLLAILSMGLLAVWLWWSAVQVPAQRTISYAAFKQHLAAGEVKRVEVGEAEIRGEIEPDSAVPADGAVGEAADASGSFAFRTVRMDDPTLVERLEASGVEFEGVQSSRALELLLAWVVPIGLVVVLWIFLMRRAAGPGQAAAAFGKSRAKLVAEREIGVGFADVAGCDEAKTELAEIVEFLRSPERFTRIGATIPRGVLLTGPPGTGKTLMARAVAGEAEVPFYSLSGSDFVEMFVGVGAARVRDLFTEAKQHAPCIVFIDELDAIGRARGVHLSSINDEREHTLNQLLVEMDGFEANSGVIILSATNRPDVLDPALLRPGRFDRQVVLDAPDRTGREQILRVHARGKRLARAVDLGAIAAATPGFAGADLANAMNEAALLAARRGAEEISQQDLEEAMERVVAGPERRSRRLEESEKRRIAYHEAGHALVAFYSEHADPVHKISIVPRGQAALGYTLQLPTGDHYLLERSALIDRLRGLLGGRAAEDLVLGEVSTGAENDLEQATLLARRLVCQYGMGQSAGLMHCARPGGPFDLIDPNAMLQRSCSEATAAAIDDEVKSLLDDAYQAARQTLASHRDRLERLATKLFEHETLDESAITRLLDDSGEAVSPPARAAH